MLRTLMVLLVLAPGISLGQWDGKQAQIKKDAIGCVSISSLEEMNLFAKAGNQQAQDAYFSQNICIKFPYDARATVIKDASASTDPQLAQVMLVLQGGDIIKLWMMMSHMECCYDLE